MERNPIDPECSDNGEVLSSQDSHIATRCISSPNASSVQEHYATDLRLLLMIHRQKMGNTGRPKT